MGEKTWFTGGTQMRRNGIRRLKKVSWQASRESENELDRMRTSNRERGKGVDIGPTR